MEKTAICYITDNAYVMPTTVSLVSLFKNNKTPADIYVLAVDLSDKNREHLESIKYVKVLNLENKYDFIHEQHPYVSKAALFKFDLAEIFTNYNKILYVDSDTLILNDLNALLSVDIEDYYAAVVKDIFAYFFLDAENIGLDDGYFNSGVMLLNAKKMRQDKIKDKLLETKKNSPHQKYMDQDTFNLVFNGHVKYITPNFNYLSTNSKFKKGTIKSFFNIKKINPVILHLTYFKPWEYKGLPFSSLWHKYYKLSPYKYEKLSLKPCPYKYRPYSKQKIKERWVIDILGLRFSYKKGLKDFRLFYP